MSPRQWRQLLWPEIGIWLALLALLLASLASAYVPLGLGNGIANYAIATAKAALVAVLFMHLRTASSLVRLAAAAGLFWLAVLFVFSFGDYLTR